MDMSLVKNKYIIVLALLLCQLMTYAQSARIIGDAFAETIHHFSATETDSLCNVLTAKYRKDSDVLTELGRAYFQNLEIRKAKEILDMAIKSDSLSDAPYVQYGDIYKYYWTTPGSLDTAQVWYRKAQFAKPMNPVAYQKEAEVLLMKYKMYGNRETHADSLMMKVVADSAIVVLTSLSNIRPDILLAPQIGDIYNKIGDFKSSAEQYALAEDSLQDYQLNNYALDYFFTKDYERGLSLAEEGIRRYPDYPQFWRTKMYCQSELKQWMASLVSYEKLISATDSLVSFDFYYAGNAYLKLNDVPKATHVFNRLYDTNDEFKYRHINAVPRLIKVMAGGYSADGDYDSAARVYTEYYQNKKNQQPFDLYSIAEVYREKSSDELLPMDERLSACYKADSVYQILQTEYPEYETILITYYRGAVMWTVDAEEKMVNGYAVSLFKRVISLIEESTEEVRGANQMLSTAYRYLAVYCLHHDLKTKAKQYARKYKEVKPDDTALDAILQLR